MTDLLKIYAQANTDFDKFLVSGDFITEEEALAMIGNFNNHHVEAFFDVKVLRLKKILNQLKVLFATVTRLEPAFRLYVGLRGDVYNIVAVPIATKKVEPGEARKHETDLEATFFDLRKVKFFALKAVDGGISNNVTECGDLVRTPDGSGKKVVFYTVEGLERFLDKINPNALTVRFNFARLDNQPDAALTLILQGMSKVKGLISTAIVETDKGKAKLQGVYFDRADLIPPPPSNGTDVDDSSF